MSLCTELCHAHLLRYDFSNIKVALFQVTYFPELGLVTASADATIKITDISHAQVIRTVTHHSRSVSCFAYSRTFGAFASGGTERNIIIWQANRPAQTLFHW